MTSRRRPVRTPAARTLRGAFGGYVAVVVAVPLAALLVHGFQGGLAGVWRAATSPVAASSLLLTFWTAVAMAAVNAVMGTATAWVLVRYRFPGRGLLSALVDIPFAVPTLVAGIMVVVLFGPQSGAGVRLAAHGLRVAYAPASIVLCLTFVTLPFVVRAVEPVLMELDPAEEEAARTMGAGPLTVFAQVLLPPLVPAIASGTLQAFARALAEFGSVVIASGNIPGRTLTASVYVYGEIEAGRSEAAAAVSAVLLGFALALMGLARLSERLAGVGRG